MSVAQQAHVCGVLRRRIDQLVESLGLRLSQSEASRISGLLDEKVQAFRPRDRPARDLGLQRGAAEIEAFWTEFLRSLVARGLVGLQLAISDAHPD